MTEIDQTRPMTRRSAAMSGSWYRRQTTGCVSRAADAPIVTGNKIIRDRLQRPPRLRANVWWSRLTRSIVGKQPCQARSRLCSRVLSGSHARCGQHSRSDFIGMGFFLGSMIVSGIASGNLSFKSRLYLSDVGRLPGWLFSAGTMTGCGAVTPSVHNLASVSAVHT
jgi:hypothetical protein